MKFFIDTANVDYIKEANDMGIICGVTTNPSLIAKEGRVFEEVIAEIASIVDGPISGEVKATTTDAETMIKEGIAISKIHQYNVWNCCDISTCKRTVDYMNRISYAGCNDLRINVIIHSKDISDSADQIHTWCRNIIKSSKEWRNICCTCSCCKKCLCC